MHELSTPFGALALDRHPTHAGDDLLPFDGADRHLLEEIAERHAGVRSVLVVGDRHGALSTALAGSAEVTMYSDSVLARTATRLNLDRNGRRAVIAGSLREAGRPELVVVRPGKARALLDEQLHEIAEALEPRTPVLLAEMVKHLGRWMTASLEAHTGPVTASLARFKSRVLRCERSTHSSAAPDWTSYTAPGGITLHNAPGTFASSGLDGGARLLLQHLPSSLGEAEVVDLGCGNGVLGIASAMRNPQARYRLVDESAAAVASAARSWEANLPGREARVVHGDGLAGADAASVDVVLCNPPFHAGSTIDEWAGRRLLEQARRALRPGGELYLVANRHLRHHQHLRDHFADVEVLGADARFSVLRGRRPR